jgi:hypothetical protein
MQSRLHDVVGATIPGNHPIAALTSAPEFRVEPAKRSLGSLFDRSRSRGRNHLVANRMIDALNVAREAYLCIASSQVPLPVADRSVRRYHGFNMADFRVWKNKLPANSLPAAVT